MIKLRTSSLSGRATRIVSLAALAAVCLVYSLQAVRAPFFAGGDLTSNLLPIVQYKRSILVEDTLPWYTDLWYGGRHQWMNPLWSFFYLPSTLIWLAFPLDWAARVVMVGHFVASAWAGRSLASLFLDRELDRLLAALLFASPIVIGITGGQLEKVLAWPWVLLGLRLLLDPKMEDWKRGLLSGLCLGVIALTGAMYYWFYSAILLLTLALNCLSWQLLIGFIGGALLGLIHLPSVLYLGLSPRDPVGYSVTLLEAGRALFVGFRDPAIRWEVYAESFAVVGAAMIPLVLWSIYAWRREVDKHLSPRISLAMALWLSGGILLLLASGAAYEGHHLLDTLRTTGRAMAFVAVVVVLLALLYAREFQANSVARRTLFTVLLGGAVLQTILVWNELHPKGLSYWLDDGATQVAEYLEQEGATSVWIDVTNYRHEAGETGKLIGIALNQRGIALPDWYYGNMGQVTPLNGPFCGYPFDHLVLHDNSAPSTNLELEPNCYHCKGVIHVPEDQLQLLKSVYVADQQYHVYGVICPE